MNANRIQIGRKYRLRSDNPYGFHGPELYVTVSSLRTTPGYKTPWVIDVAGRAFKPSDIERGAVV